MLKEFETKSLGEYHDQSDTLLLSDVFGNFRSKCVERYKLDPALFLSAPGLAWQACLKKTGVKLGLLTGVNMLLMIKKGIRGRISHTIHRYAKENDKYIKNYNIYIEPLYLRYLDGNNLYDRECLKNCLQIVLNG